MTPKPKVLEALIWLRDVGIPEAKADPRTDLDFPCHADGCSSCLMARLVALDHGHAYVGLRNFIKYESETWHSIFGGAKRGALDDRLAVVNRLIAEIEKGEAKQNAAASLADAGGTDYMANDRPKAVPPEYDPCT